MRKIIFAILIVLLNSCKENKEPEISTIRTGLLMDLDSIVSNSTSDENNLKDVKTAEIAGAKYLTFLKKENSISDYPVFFERALEDSDGYSWTKFRTAVYQTEEDSVQNYSNYEKISFQILAKLKTEEALKLKENQPYFLYGKLIEKGWVGNNISSEFSPTFTSGKFDFGNVTYKIDSIK